VCPPERRAASTPFSTTLVLFVASGATGLVDQLCFSKYLAYIVGSTAHAVSAVLAAFMTGLALGAHFGGRRSVAARRPLFAYGVLELVVAGSVVLVPLAFTGLTPLYVSLARSAPDSLPVLSALRWLTAMLLVIVPTTAMGATLPLLARSLGADAGERKQRKLGALYAANTLGGAIGALGAAYVVLPALGLSSTLFASAAASAAIGVVALLIGRQKSVAEPPVEARAEAAPATAAGSGELRALVVLALLSGWLVFMAEVVFTHLLALVIGNSAYAFGLILAVFLTFLFVGASRAPVLSKQLGDAALPWGLVGSGAALAVTLPLWDELPLLFAGTGVYVTSFFGREVLRAVAAFSILALPVTAMGLTFPLLLQRVAQHAEVGRWVGKLTAVNTIGAVLGSLSTGYLVLPWLGSQRTLVLAAGAFVVAGLLIARRSLGARLAPIAALGAIALGGGTLAPRWDLARLTSGSNVYFDGAEPPDEISMMEEDVQGGVTTVTRTGSVHTLFTNGKFQGNTGWEMNAQRFFAHYPSLFVNRFDRALVIGLGTGTTLGTLAAYPWQRLDVVEISPSIERAARRYFRESNLGALDDPRVKLTLADGRNFLLVSSEKYDLVSMELSSIWFAGASSLYSREFYRLVHDHLTPGGVLQQWVQMHHIRRRDFATVLMTLRAEFEHVVLFYGGGQGILVASNQPLVASAARVHELEERPRIRAVIPEGRPLISLLDDVLASGASLDRYLAAVARDSGVPPGELVSTDDNLYLEYATPRGNVLSWSSREELVLELLERRDPADVAKLRAP
jgi:spermidine synthase